MQNVPEVRWFAYWYRHSIDELEYRLRKSISGSNLFVEMFGVGYFCMIYINRQIIILDPFCGHPFEQTSFLIEADIHPTLK